MIVVSSISLDIRIQLSKYCLLLYPLLARGSLHHIRKPRKVLYQINERALDSKTKLYSFACLIHSTCQETYNVIPGRTLLFRSITSFFNVPGFPPRKLPVKNCQFGAQASNAHTAKVYELD